jgi:signal transduction histidine kinase
MDSSAAADAAPSAAALRRGTPPGADAGVEGPFFDNAPTGLLRNARWIGWRWRLLVAAVLLGCIGLFALARSLAALPQIDATWTSNAAGQLVLVHSEHPALAAYEDRVLTGLGSGTSSVAVDALLLRRSARWIVDDASRERHAELHRRVAEALAQPRLRLVFGDTVLVLQPARGGYAGFGVIFWLLCATALALYLVAMVALLARPGTRNLLYAVIAWCQCGNLLFMAVESILQLGLPPGLPTWDAQARMAFDLVTAAAVVHATTLHPTRLPGARPFALVAWATAATLLLLALAGQLSNVWWETQLAAIGCGLIAMGLLTWSYRLEPHPLAMLLRRFGGVAVGALVLLTAAVAAAAGHPEMQNAIAGTGAGLWYVFFAFLLLLLPFLSRSRELMREFALLAAISALATSLDLLFLAAFSLGQFASLALSLFLALGVYAGARQWLLSQLLGSSVLTTERMFEQLYRIAHELESHPQSAPTQLSRLLRELFEPLEVLVIDKRCAGARVAAQGSTLLVPVPELTPPGRNARHGTARTVVMRYAHRGRRLFTLEDARLIDRVLEQLRRAVAFDKAVEQGRSEERARLAQDLHDDIGARLLTLMYTAPTPEMEDYVRHTLQDLKTLTRGLAAPSHRLSHAAPEWKADLTQRLAAAHIELDWSLAYDEDTLLSVVQWSALTRVLRELVSNAIAHADATRVAVDFQLRAGRLDLVVSDDGHGRAPRAWAHGLGLGGVRKRVKQLGGAVEWVELSPHGIACKVHIPDLSQRR